jgi:hypothetical protein
MTNAKPARLLPALLAVAGLITTVQPRPLSAAPAKDEATLTVVVTGARRRGRRRPGWRRRCCGLASLPRAGHAEDREGSGCRDGDGSVTVLGRGDWESWRSRRLEEKI